MTTSIFTEAIDLTEATIDTQNRVLKDVVLIRAGDSANSRHYPAEVLAASAPIFEGVSAFMNHPTRAQIKNGEGRGMQEFTGVYRNVRFENNTIKADRYFSPNAAGNDALAIAEAVINGDLPRSAVGLSINAVGRARKEDKRVIVEAITAAESVDDVVRPAAGGSYAEAVSSNDLAQAFYDALDYDEWLSIREDFTARYENEHRKVRWNAELKEAKHQGSEYAARVQDLEAQLAKLTEQREQAEQTAQLAERKVRVIETLAAAKIPAQWKADLKATLLEAAPDQWDAILQREISKAKSAGHQPRVQVNVPGPQEHRSPTVAVRESLAPYDDEDPVQYASRLRRMRQGQQ